MSVMFPRFFGIPQHLVRSGQLQRLKPAQLFLYLALLYESERCCTRALDRSDHQLIQLNGVSARSLRDARIKLQEHGLIEYQRQPGRKFRYVLSPAILRLENPFQAIPRLEFPTCAKHRMLHQRQFMKQSQMLPMKEKPVSRVPAS